MEAKLYRGAIPTEEDIKKLREAFPDDELTPGAKIAYSEIVKVLGVGSRSCRFRTCTTRWRKRLEEESGVILVAIKGIGFKITTDTDRLDLSTSKAKMALRAAHRSKEVGKTIDRQKLTEDEQKRLDVTLRFAAAIAGVDELRSKASLPTL